MYVYIDKDKVVLSCGVVSSLINQLNLIKKKKAIKKKIILDLLLISDTP